MSSTTTAKLHHFLHIPQQQLQDMSHKRVSLIKRPPLVRSVSPNLSEGLHRTASNASLNKYHRKPKKSVRFCDNASLENVRLFLKTQMPKACRSDPACLNKKYTFHIRQPNWPNSTTMSRRNCEGGTAVRLEDVHLSKQQQQNDENKGTHHVTLLGSIQVANLAFQKKVIVRYTLDDWHTANEVEAQYQEPIAHTANTWDRFSFKINVDANINAAHESLFLAVKYNVSGREFWDNNNHKNYQVDIVPDVELDLGDSSSTLSSSSSDDDDDDHTFEDCITHEDEKELQELQQKLALTNLKERYDFNAASVEKPWSPPLSPTTPVDSAPLWIGHNSSNHHSSYFESKPTAANRPIGQQDKMTRANEFHNLIQKYCFYDQHRKSPIFDPCHTDVPSRCSSPTLKAIRS